ncbi:MAG: ParB/RepB/Spo0J family partition protein [Pseudomonadota bacterium]
MSKRKGLGRGLDALLAGSQQARPLPPDTTTSTPDAATEQAAKATAPAARDVPGTDPGIPTDGLGDVPIDQIYQGRYQPRRVFEESALEDLAQSIRAQGLMQPIVLRARAEGGYEIVAGERRWRAAQIAGLTRIPALVREIDDEHAMAMGLIENIQREDLNPLEQALAMQRLRDEFELTQQQIADMLGKSRVAVANMLRLLNLAPGARAALEAGELEMGHARALLALEPALQDQLAREVAARALTVRATEQRVRRLHSQTRDRDAGGDGAKGKDADTRNLERELSDKLGAPVALEATRGGGGRLTIRYTSLDELDGILSHLRK